MSEYQYYEFMVVDRPLDERQLAELRELSTRARITEDDDVEPPVPANLTRPTASLRALADFLHVDEDLVAVAAMASQEAEADPGSDGELARCIEDLPVAEKNALLLRAVRGDGAHLRAELRRRVPPDANSGSTPGESRRRVAEVLAAADARRQERKRRVAEQKARERARREREAAVAYEKRLDALALRENAAWRQVDALVEARSRPNTTRPCGCSEPTRSSAVPLGGAGRIEEVYEQYLEFLAGQPGREGDREAAARACGMDATWWMADVGGRAGADQRPSHKGCEGRTQRAVPLRQWSQVQALLRRLTSSSSNCQLWPEHRSRQRQQIEPAIPIPRVRETG